LQLHEPIHVAVFNPLLRGTPENLVFGQSRCPAPFIIIAVANYATNYDYFGWETLEVPRLVIEVTKDILQQLDLRRFATIIEV